MSLSTRQLTFCIDPFGSLQLVTDFHIVKERLVQALMLYSSQPHSIKALTDLDTVDGGAKEDRTPDLLRARQALSQLSYGPKNRTV